MKNAVLLVILSLFVVTAQAEWTTWTLTIDNQSQAHVRIAGMEVSDDKLIDVFRVEFSPNEVTQGSSQQYTIWYDKAVMDDYLNDPNNPNRAGIAIAFDQSEPGNCRIVTMVQKMGDTNNRNYSTSMLIPCYGQFQINQANTLTPTVIFEALEEQ